MSKKIETVLVAKIILKTKKYNLLDIFWQKKENMILFLYKIFKKFSFIK